MMVILIALMSSLGFSTSAQAAGPAAQAASPTTHAATKATHTPITRSTPILDDQALDRNQNPCENFYQFACGGWLQKTKVPADKNSVIRQAAELDESNERLLNQILKNFAAGKTQNPTEAKLGRYYASCVNPDTSKSQATLQALLSEIEKISDRKSLAAAVAKLHLQDMDVLFDYTVMTDINDSQKNTGYFDLGGLGLSGREAYFGDPSNPKDTKWKETLQKYQAHIEKMLSLAGFKPEVAKASAPQILEFEKALASGALSREEARDPDKTNHPMKRQDFEKLAPGFDWQNYFTELGTANLADVNVTQPAFFQNLNKLLKTHAKILKFYFSWRILHANASVMGGEFAKENFNFYGLYLRGKKTQEARWKTCTQLVGTGMTDALAKAWVDRMPGAEARAATHQMIGEVKETFRQRLLKLSWLDEATRNSAIEKLDKLREKVGYPDQWKNYDSLKMNSDSILENEWEASQQRERENFQQAGQPVNHTLWDMPPWEINAYYDPSQNEFVFPLAQLLPPSLDLTASAGANWGALGATLGHEMSHGFDDEGHQYDASGNLKDWWTPAVSDEFNRRAQCYVDQANQYEALPGLFVNGQATLGENLADQGGTLMAYLAYKEAAARRGSAASDVAGFNEDQQFFVSYAQSWCAKLTDSSLRLQVQTDPHPPAEFRVNMVLRNMSSFRSAFQCTEGTKMAPAKTCELW